MLVRHVRLRWYVVLFFFSSRRRHTRYWRDWSSDVCSSDLHRRRPLPGRGHLVADRDRPDHDLATARRHPRQARLGDRKSVVEGKSVDLGGRRIIKKKKNSVALSLPSPQPRHRASSTTTSLT